MENSILSKSDRLQSMDSFMISFHKNPLDGRRSSWLFDSYNIMISTVIACMKIGYYYDSRLGSDVMFREKSPSLEDLNFKRIFFTWYDSSAIDVAPALAFCIYSYLGKTKIPNYYTFGK